MDESEENRLKRAIKELGLNQTKLADAVGIKQSTLSEAISKGRVSQEIAEYIGKTYNVNLNWLYLNNGPMINDAVIEKGKEKGDKNLSEQLDELKDQLLSVYSELSKTQQRLQEVLFEDWLKKKDQA